MMPPKMAAQQADYDPICPNCKKVLALVCTKRPGSTKQTCGNKPAQCLRLGPAS